MALVNRSGFYPGGACGGKTPHDIQLPFLSVFGDQYILQRIINWDWIIDKQ